MVPLIVPARQVSGRLPLSTFDDNGGRRPDVQDAITIDQHVGLCLSAGRRASGLSVAQAAAKIGLSDATLVAIEAGTARPTASCLVMLSALLDIKLTELFLGHVSAGDCLTTADRRHRAQADNDNVIALPDHPR